ncbi:MAG: hypothetical protein COA57_13805 [Flavobacteriales bacterium]|nr:MAG: hypothetical protein COA57_13805 [Flavobacteriales bacterium]
MIVSIKPQIDLSRYDIGETPEEWDSKSHCLNTEYRDNNGKGPKNKSGFYFLFDNIETTQAVAKIACNKNEIKDNYWLTITQTTDTISIIDFSKCKCIHDILVILDSLNINIYNSNMIINGFEDKKIDDLKTHNHLTRVIPYISELMEVKWFGQMLTDFDNGETFKELANVLKIDGYRWCENINPYGLTYCLFDHNKIEQPSKRKILIE